MEISFTGKKALVTGAGKGIGRAIAIALSKCGAQTYALSRTNADLDSLQQEDPSIRTVCVDLADWSATQKAVEGVGHVDLLVNNAGIARLAQFLDIPEQDIDDIFNINVKAVINVSQVVSKSMISHGGGGCIVHMSSAASLLPLQDHTVYCLCKAALDALTKNMALELGKHQIRVNAVNPTVVLTDMGKMAWSDPAKSGPMLARIPLGKFIEVSDVVSAVLFLLSDKAGMITGVTLPVEGGLTVS